MSDLSELYQQVILDHNRTPRNFHVLEDANRTARGHNPLCGDQLNLFLNVKDGIVADVGFTGAGCAISKASASIMTETLKGKTTDEARAIYKKFHELLTGPPDVKADARSMGKLAVFAGVREFPVRVKCATLAWHTMASALDSGIDDRGASSAGPPGPPARLAPAPVSTESE